MGNHRNLSGLWSRPALVVGVIVLASGCGGSVSKPDASSSPTANVAKAVAYANCMREHGVDVSVGSNGNINITSGGSGGGSGSGGQQQSQAAENACRNLLPPASSQVQAHQEQALKQALKYTLCMRSHGMPDFPDPSEVSGRPIGFSGVDAASPAYPKANQVCQSQLPGSGS
jgi:hypothetical protein